jgi:hypothetical protein
MGTRHLIAVQLDGEYKIANYGQWDGYPSGQGVDVLAFLKSVDTDAFKEKLRSARFIDQESPEGKAYIAKVNNTPDWPKAYPWLSRDAGSDILSLVLEQPHGIQLFNGVDFAGDSLFGEYAYVIDYDHDTFEVYQGFNKQPVPDGERFAQAPMDDRQPHPVSGEIFYPVKHWRTWPLDALPTEEDFLAALTDEDTEE